MIQKPFTIKGKALEDSQKPEPGFFTKKPEDTLDESDQIDQNFNTLFDSKLEEFKHCVVSGTTVTVAAKTQRESETGNATKIGTESTTQQITIAFATKYNQVLNIEVNSVGASFTTSIVNFTASSMVVQLSATASLGTQSYQFFYRITGTIR